MITFCLASPPSSPPFPFFDLEAMVTTMRCPSGILNAEDTAGVEEACSTSSSSSSFSALPEKESLRTSPLQQREEQENHNDDAWNSKKKNKWAGLLLPNKVF
jgi:hypothetical protein